MIDRPTKAPRRQERPQAQTAAQTQQAPPSEQVEEMISESVKETTFEPIPEAASASPQAQSAAGTSRRDAMPEAVVRPRQPARPAVATPTPWLPPALSALLPRLTLAAALLAAPIAAAAALQIWLARTHVAYDENLLLADGGADEVTALQWSPTDGVLYVGTRSGSSTRISAGGTMEEILSPRDIDAADGIAVSPVRSFHSLQAQWPVVVYQDRLNPATDRPADGFAATQTTPGLFSFEGGLFASVEANNGSAVVGRAVTNDGGQRFNNLVNAVNQLAPQQQAQQQQAQQQQIQPPGKQPQSVRVGDFFTPQGELKTVQSGPPGYTLTLYRDLHSASATQVGEIFGIEDVRAVAALPGTDTVIAGDGAGNVFAIDASQQISGASPETYIRGIGQHETAIVEIAVAAHPDSDGVLFATRAEDRTIKVWRGGVNRASQLIPLGDYSNTDVATPGSTWVREPIRLASAPQIADPSLVELLSMSDDGQRILARRASGGLVLIHLPARVVEGESAATGSDEINYVGQNAPAILSPDGSRLVAAEPTNATVEMFDLSGIASGQASPSARTSFRGLETNQFRSFAFDRSGQRFVAVAVTGSVYVQDVSTPDEAITLGQYQNTGIATAISPDGSLVAVAESNNRITIHSGEDGSELTFFEGPQNLDRLVFDNSGRRLRVSTIDAARIYTYSLRSLRSTMFGPNLLAEAGRDGFIPNGNRVFSRNGDAGFRIIDIDSGATVGTLLSATGATGWLSSLDGSRIATLGGRGNISLFREEGSPTATGPMPLMADNALRLSSDGRTLAVGGRGGELYVARLDGDAGETGYRLRRLALPTPALQYDISPDGASIATAEADGTVTISDLTFGSSATGAPANQVQTAGAAPESTPVPAPAVTVAKTIEISGHGAPLTAMALSPDGERLATASLDGRLRITSIAWARLVHRLPLAALPSGPEREKLEPQPLDDSPYALMSGFGGNSDFGNSQASGGPFIVVYNASRSLAEAQRGRDRAAAAGFPDGLIFRRQGFFRGVFSFTTAEARDEALPRIRQAFSGAYGRELPAWCPRAAAVPNENFIDCEAVVAGTAPRAMAN